MRARVFSFSAVPKNRQISKRLVKQEKKKNNSETLKFYMRSRYARIRTRAVQLYTFVIVVRIVRAKNRPGRVLKSHKSLRESVHVTRLFPW